MFSAYEMMQNTGGKTTRIFFLFKQNHFLGFKIFSVYEHPVKIYSRSKVPSVK